MYKLRILLADDHAMLRDGLCVLLNEQPDMEVIAQATTGRQALQLARECAPDIAVLDISMPDMAGLEAAQNIVARCPRTRVIALSRHGDPAYARRVLHAGVAGYVLKRSAAEALIRAIRIVSQGANYVEPDLASALSGSETIRAANDRPLPGKLSFREEGVLRSIAWGLSNKEIAAELGLSIKTVESYKASGVEKLRLRTRSDIVRYAVASGWMNAERVQE